MNRIAEGYVKLGTWGLHLFLLNLLWLLFSAGGLLVAGLFPATAALFSVVKRLMEEKDDIRIFKEFWTQFKEHFIRANVLGYTLLLAGALLYIDFRVMQQLVGTSVFHLFLLTFLYLFIFFYLFAALYAFPILVHYRMNVWGCLKYSLIMAVGKPLQSLGLVLALGVLFWLYAKVPGLVPVFGASFIPFVILKIVLRSFGNPMQAAKINARN